MLLDTSTQHEGELKCTSNTTQIHLKCTPPHSSSHTYTYRETVALHIRVCSRSNSGTYLGSTSRKSTRAHITAQPWRRARLDLSRMEQGRACMCKRARGIDSTSTRRIHAPIHHKRVYALSYSRCCLFCLVAILKVESKGLELELLSSSNPFSCFPAPSQGQRHGARGGGGLQPDVAARPLIGPEFCSVFTRGECLLSPLDLLSCPSIMLQCLLSAYINAVHPATLFKFIPAGM